MRGQQSLFQDVFIAERTKVSQRTRNCFQPQRNEALLNRYYYHAEINRYRYEDCLTMLEQEFYLTSIRIIAILMQNNNRLSQIARAKPTISQLSKRFPHFVWRKR